jgi:hypothetical protein
MGRALPLLLCSQLLCAAASVIELHEANWDEALQASPKGLFVKFFAPWVTAVFLGPARASRRPSASAPASTSASASQATSDELVPPLALTLALTLALALTLTRTVRPLQEALPGLGGAGGAGARRRARGPGRPDPIGRVRSAGPLRH